MLFSFQRPRASRRRILFRAEKKPLDGEATSGPRCGVPSSLSVVSCKAPSGPNRGDPEVWHLSVPPSRPRPQISPVRRGRESIGIRQTEGHGRDNPASPAGPQGLSVARKMSWRLATVGPRQSIAADLGAPPETEIVQVGHKSAPAETTLGPST